jgi:hypothetical protein
MTDQVPSKAACGTCGEPHYAGVYNNHSFVGKEQRPSKERVGFLIDYWTAKSKSHERWPEGGHGLQAELIGLIYADTIRALRQMCSAAEPAGGQVDWLGLALELESQAKRVESQTVERAMLAAAHGLRLMGAAQPPRDE